MECSGRDIELGKRLRRLEVPEHEPGFFATLEDRMEAELPSLRSRRRSWLRLAWIPIPVAIVILLVLWAFADDLGIDSLRPQAASAAEITQRAADAAANAEALRATLVVRVLSQGEGGTYLGPLEAEALGGPFTFLATAEGDYRTTGLAGAAAGFDMAYDHRAGVFRTIAGYGSGEVYALEATGVPAGPPDSFFDGYDDLGAAVRALRESPEAQVEEGTYEGRNVWVLSTDLAPNLITRSGFDHMDVTVAKDVGLPVHVVYWMKGNPVLDWSLSHLEVDPDLPADAFVLEIPPDIPADRIEYMDYGFRSVELASLSADGAEAVGYVPVLPVEVPDGFVLAEVKVADVGQPSGKEGMNPPGTGVVSAIYRRGFDRLVVSTRMVGEDPSLWSDPMASGEGYIDDPERITLTSGEFEGSRAEIVVNIRTRPHLWAMNDTLVLTVTGDLARDEMVAVAESFAPVE